MVLCFKGGVSNGDGEGLRLDEALSEQIMICIDPNEIAIWNVGARGRCWWT